jgi:hypothetical protein
MESCSGDGTGQSDHRQHPAIEKGRAFSMSGPHRLNPSSILMSQLRNLCAIKADGLWSKVSMATNRLFTSRFR